MTPAALLMSIAGLSRREASDFLNVRPDTVQSWHRKTHPKIASPGVIDELKSLVASQERAAAEFLNQLAELTRVNGPPVDIELGYPTDDCEAQALGCPCVGAWQAMAARVIAKSPVPVRLVPRGSTVATAAAADAHERCRWPAAPKRSNAWGVLVRHWSILGPSLRALVRGHERS